MPLILEALYWGGASVLGFCLVQSALPTLSTATRVGLGIAVGISAFFAIDLGIGVLPIGAGPIVAGVLKLLAVVGVACASFRAWERQSIGLVLVLGLPILLALLQGILSAAVLSFDSYTYLALSQTHFVAGFDFFNEIQRGFYASYSAGLWVSHANAGLWGADFLALFHPLVLCATLLIVLGAIQDLTGTTSPISSFVVGAVILVFALTAPQFLQHATYIIPNTLGGLLFAGLIVTVLSAQARQTGPGRNYYWVVLAVLCLAFAFSRLEASVFFALITALIAARPTDDDGADYGIVGLFLGAALAFQIFVHLVGRNSGSSILTIDFSIALVLISVVALIGLILVRRTPLRALAPYLPVLTVFAVLALVAALTLIRGEHAEISNRMFALNTLGHAGIWFNAWLVIGLAVLYYAGVNPSLDFRGRFLVAVLIAGMLLIIGLGILRDPPYRLGAQDSGNRMLLVLFPIGLIILGLSLHRIKDEFMALLTRRQSDA